MMAPGVVVCDRYRIVRVVGEGGMGVVFEAEHTGVGRKVALKALRADVVATPEAVLRFQREARAAAAIGHDNIIEVMDFGVHEGVPFMVMEMLAGEALDQRLAHEGKLPLPLVVHILTQVLSAVGAAHKAGIIHRDMKPGNVFLAEKSGVRDFVKLLDFGIAKLGVDEVGPDGKVKAITQTGVLMGTPDYMAPEQALATGDADPRTDLYAAGVMLYEMTTGTLPFASECEAEVLLEAAYHLHPMQLPSARDAGLPPELDAVVLRAMSIRREDRYQDAAEFASALARLRTAPARSTGSEPPARRTTRSFGGIEGSIEARPSLATETPSDMVPPCVALPPTAAGHDLPPGPRKRFETRAVAAWALVLALAVAIAGALAFRSSESAGDAAVLLAAGAPATGAIVMTPVLYRDLPRKVEPLPVAPATVASVTTPVIACETRPGSGSVAPEETRSPIEGRPSHAPGRGRSTGSARLRLNHFLNPLPVSHEF